MYIIPDKMRNEMLELLVDLNECTKLLINCFETLQRIEEKEKEAN
jgi:hypothetical protein